MTVDIDILEPGRVAVTRTPSMIRRVLFGVKAETFFAIRVLSINGGWTWRWDHSGHLVDPGSLARIESAFLGHHRSQLNGVVPRA